MDVSHGAQKKQGGSGGFIICGFHDQQPVLVAHRPVEVLYPYADLLRLGLEARRAFVVLSMSLLPCFENLLVLMKVAN